MIGTEAEETSPLTGVVPAAGEAAAEAPAEPAAASVDTEESPGVPASRLEIARPPVDEADAPARPAPPRPARPTGRAEQRAMTRWRDRVEVVSEESEIPLPSFDGDDGEATRRAGTSG